MKTRIKNPAAIYIRVFAAFFLLGLTTQPLQAAEPERFETLIEGRLYRGVTPSAADVDFLKEKNVSLIIDLSNTSNLEGAFTEEGIAVKKFYEGGTGVNYNITFKPPEGAITAAEVTSYFADLRAILREPILGWIKQGQVIYISAEKAELFKTTYLGIPLLYRSRVCLSIDRIRARRAVESVHSDIVRNDRTPSGPAQGQFFESRLLKWGGKVVRDGDTATAFEDVDRAMCDSPGDIAEEEGFILKEHLPLMQRVSREQKTLISVRDTGNYSLLRIRQGFPCKGHSVLEKSLKPAALWKVKEKEGLDNAWVSTQWRKIRTEKVQGFVGKWGRRAPLGVYVIRDLTPTPLDFADLNSENRKFALTGDYDLHDMLYYTEAREGADTVLKFDYVNPLSTIKNKDMLVAIYPLLFLGGRVQIPEAPKAANREYVIIRALNDALMGERKETRTPVADGGVFPEDAALSQNYALIQHGAQQNYGLWREDQIKWRDAYEKDVESLHKPDFPLLVVFDAVGSVPRLRSAGVREAIIIRTKQELVTLYAFIGLRGWWESGVEAERKKAM